MPRAHCVSTIELLVVWLTWVAIFPASAVGQATVRASVSSDGSQGNGRNGTYADLSEDGRFVVFFSEASNLVAGDTNGVADVFLHDRTMRTTERLSVNSSGAQGDAQSSYPRISADGRFVVFASQATNLVSGDTNSSIDVFVLDRVTGQLERASVSSSGQEGHGWSATADVSTDGRYVVFSSDASDLVPQDSGWWDVFVHDRTTGETTRISTTSTGGQGFGDSNRSAISADGSVIVFRSEANNLLPGDTGYDDIFAYDRLSQTLERVSVDVNGTQANADSWYENSISGNGRYVAFWSSASDLVPSDTNGYPDAFLRDRALGVTELISVDSNGVQANSHSGSPSVSPDGTWVAFWSVASNLVEDDTSYMGDVFVRDRTLGTTARVSLSWRNEQSQGGDSVFPVIDRKGRYVMFSSEATNLVRADGNGAPDIFVRDLMQLDFIGRPKNPDPVHFYLGGARGESGGRFGVLLSASGTSGFRLADGRWMPLVFDAGTIAGFSQLPYLTGVIDHSGNGTTATLSFPPAPAGVSFFAAAITFDWIQGRLVSISAPVTITTE